MGKLTFTERIDIPNMTFKCMRNNMINITYEYLEYWNLKSKSL